MAEDNENVTPETPAERKISERERVVEELANRQSAELYKELGIERDPAQVPDVDPDVDPPAPAPKPETKATEPEEFVVDTNDLSKYKVRVKIDGEESLVDLDAAMRQYQKNGAADKRLAEATRLLREAEARAAAPQPAPAPAPAPAPEADGVDDAFIDALFEGDKETSRAKLKQLVAGRQQVQTTPDPEQLLQSVLPKIRQQLSIESALDRFREDNADLVKDPYLVSITERHWAEEVQAGKDEATALRDAGLRTRDWLKTMGVQSAKPATTMTREEKLDRKKAMDTLPEASARSSIPDEAPQGTSDVIAEMRKARGFA